jgi:hypothetical protein
MYSMSFRQNFDVLTPNKVLLQKIRVGNPDGDGGYVFPIGVRVDALLSYGVGGDVSFEEGFKGRFSKPVACFDHTVNSIPSEDKDIQFFQEGVSNTSSGMLGTIESHVKKLGWAGIPIALKMDVEGAEWDVLDDISRQSEVKILVIELHDLCREMRPSLIRLHDSFFCIHVHGNNYCGVSTYDKVYPNTVEAVFIRRGEAEPDGIDYGSFPTVLDIPNSGSSDIRCDWWM